MSKGVTGTFVISLDFELYWGVRDTKPLGAYRDNLRGVRRVVPALLELFSEYDIRATWATVGFLFCESREELIEFLPEIRPHYVDDDLSPYDELHELGKGEDDDPYHYAPSLIEAIADGDGQEIASHTFSHYYCLEKGQTEAAFEADLAAAMEVAKRRGMELKSLVFPRNQVNRRYLDICRDAGLWAYRGNPNPWYYQGRGRDSERLWHRGLRLADAYLPISRGFAGTASREDPKGLMDVAASRFLRPYNPEIRPAETLRLHRIKNEMKRAAERGQRYHLWWHPHNFGVNMDENLAFLTEILEYFQKLRHEKGMESKNMKQVAMPIHEEQVEYV